MSLSVIKIASDVPISTYHTRPASAAVLHFAVKRKVVFLVWLARELRSTINACSDGNRSCRAADAAVMVAVADEDGGRAAPAEPGRQGVFATTSRLALTLLWLYVYIYDPDSIYSFTICILVCYFVMTRYSRN